MTRLCFIILRGIIKELRDPCWSLPVADREETLDSPSGKHCARANSLLRSTKRADADTSDIPV